MSSPSRLPKFSNPLKIKLFHAEKSLRVYPCQLAILLKESQKQTKFAHKETR